MKIRYYFALWLLSFVLYSCKSEPVDVLSQEKMIDILTDIHLTDAVLNEKRIFDKNIKDTLSSYYDYVWVKNDISYQEFKYSLNYYTQHTAVLNVMYDSVISRLIIMRDSIRDADEVELNKEGYLMNLWSQKTDWSLPEDGNDNMIQYNITTDKQGVYTLRAKIKQYADDGSVTQKITIAAYYDDETFDANWDYSKGEDGQWYQYEAKLRTNEMKNLNRIAGWVLDHSKLEGIKHLEVKEIELIYSSK